MICNASYLHKHCHEYTHLIAFIHVQMFCCCCRLFCFVLFGRGEGERAYIDDFCDYCDSCDCFSETGHYRHFLIYQYELSLISSNSRFKQSKQVVVDYICHFVSADLCVSTAI